MRSALVNETTYIVENIIVAEPVDPCPFAGQFMVGLEDPVWDLEATPPVMISAGTPCDIGWVYDPVTKTFSAP